MSSDSSTLNPFGDTPSDHDAGYTYGNETGDPGLGDLNPLVSTEYSEGQQEGAADSEGDSD
jgi:hypothetical protein